MQQNLDAYTLNKFTIMQTRSQTKHKDMYHNLKYLFTLTKLVVLGKPTRNQLEIDNISTFVKLQPKEVNVTERDKSR